MKQFKPSLWNATKWMTAALFWPFPRGLKKTALLSSLKKTFVFALAWGVLQPAAVMLFPRAETVLKEEGLDPALAQELAPGKKVYVRSDNFWGKTHALFDCGPYLAPLVYFQRLSSGSESSAFATPPFLFGRSDVRSIYMKSSAAQVEETEALREMIHNLSRGKLELSELVSPEEYRQMVLLHEIRHCSDENQALKDEIEKEGDSDYHAIKTLAREKNKPGLQDAFLLAAAARDSLDPDHNTALYLDALFREAALPSAGALNAANMAAGGTNTKVLTIKFSLHMRGDIPAADAQLLERIKQQETLSARRVKLFSEAWDRIMIRSSNSPTPNP